MECFVSNFPGLDNLSNGQLDQSIYSCQFCARKFDSEDEFNLHTIEHFQRKKCTECHKTLICIGSNWYGLHFDANCIKSLSTNSWDDLDAPNLDLDLTVSSDLISQGEIDEKNDVSDDSEFDQISDFKKEISIEDDVKPIFHVDVNTETEATIERTTDTSKRKETQSRKRSTRSTKRVIIESEDEDELIKKAKSKEKRKSKSKSRAKIETTLEEKPLKPKRNRGPPLARTRCNICDKIILDYNFEQHLQKMHIPKVIVPDPVKCETCGKTFASAGNLKTHNLIHTNTKRFICSYCGVSFRQLYHLSEHINAHTNSKPYQCKICNKRFNRHHILSAHQRVHTGEKPFVCDVEECTRAYAYEIDLKRHKFSVHGIYTKKHICPICSKVFSENKLLKKHLESHSAGNIRRSTTNS